MNTLLKLIAIFILTMLVLYVFFTKQNLQAFFVHDIANNSSVGPEGFEDRGSNMKEVVDNVESLVNQLDDSLHVKKYRKEYEDTVTKTDELFELMKIETLTQLKDVKDGETDKIMKIAEDLAAYQGTKDALEGCLNYIDGK